MPVYDLYFDTAFDTLSIRLSPKGLKNGGDIPFSLCRFAPVAQMDMIRFRLAYQP
jgi:hypothetical protein